MYPVLFGLSSNLEPRVSSNNWRFAIREGTCGWPKIEVPHSHFKASFNHTIASSASCCSKIMQFVATIALSISSGFKCSLGFRFGNR